MRLVPLPFGVSRGAEANEGSGIKNTRLCIEAGVKGWELIEFKELYASACEYLGSERVYKLEVTPGQSYLAQARRALEDIRPTHYVYDPRTGSQNWGAGLWQAFRVAFLLHVRGITPIAYLTDLAVRSWRAKSVVVTAKNGIVVAFLSAREVAPIFPHRRLVAPSLMPLSEATAKLISMLSETQLDSPPPKAIFAGSLYEPRTSILRAIAEGLEARGLALDIRGRKLGSPRVSDSDYWSLLINAAVVVTTADQVESRQMDWTWIQNVVYRYIEVTSCGTLLVAPDVPGIRRFFSPGIHFVPFTSPAHAVEVIEYYLRNEAERKKIAEQGRVRAQALVSARSFWMGVDIGLGKHSLT